MYFFLHNLSFVDIVYASVTFPSLLSGFLTENKTTSVPACFLQMYFYIQMGVTGRGLLTVMAYDRYVAICDPLRYTATMTGTVRVLLVLGAWTFAAGCTLPAVTMATQRFYCGPNVVFHLWCDPSSVRVLVCGNTSMDSLVSLSSALVALIGTAVLILASYVMIGVAVAKMAAAQRWKAFTTCAAHLTVVLLSYITAFFVYISYRVGNLSPEVGDYFFQLGLLSARKQPLADRIGLRCEVFFVFISRLHINTCVDVVGANDCGHELLSYDAFTEPHHLQPEEQRAERCCQEILVQTQNCHTEELQNYQHPLLFVTRQLVVFTPKTLLIDQTAQPNLANLHLPI